MDALHGLSSLAAEMPRLRTEKEDVSRQGMTETKSGDASAAGSAESISKPRADAIAFDHFLYNPKSSRGVMPLRTHHFDVGAPSAAATPIDASAAVGSAVTLALDEESNLIRLEQARRRSLLAASGRKSSAIYRPQHLELDHFLAGPPSASVPASAPASAIAATPQRQAHAPYSRIQQQLSLQDRRSMFQDLQYNALFRNETMDFIAQARAADVEARVCAGLLNDSEKRGRMLYQERLLTLQQQQQQFLYQDMMSQSALYENALPSRQTGGGFWPAASSSPRVPGGVLPNGLTMEDMAAVLEYSKANKQNDVERNSEPILKQPFHDHEVANDSPKTTEQATSATTLDEPAAKIDELPHGAKTLFLPSDTSFLSEAHCFLRSICIEPFVATSEQVEARGKGARPSRAGQVGFRCIHCRNIPRCQQVNQAVCYPSKRENIFEGVRNFQRVHLRACPYMSEEIKQRFTNLVKRGHGPKRSRKLVRAYYAQAASEVGLVDTPHGLGYREGDHTSESPSKEMQDIMEAARAEEEMMGNGALSYQSLLKKMKKTPVVPVSSSDVSPVDQDIKYGKLYTVASDNTRQVLTNAREEETPFVLPGDFCAISDFVYLLFHQLLPCKPTTATIKRRRLNPDQFQRLPGLCCKHCHKTDGISGMYFPLNIESLGDSSFSQTLNMHLKSCAYTPPDIKKALIELKTLGKKHNSIVKRGSKKIFVDKVWGRMKEISDGMGG